MNADQRFFAPCPRGLESTLGAELTRLGASAVVPGDSGVEFKGDFVTAMRANLESRLASRILWQVADGPYRHEQELYDLARALPWSEWMTADDTLLVDTRAHRSPLRSLDFVTLRVKDAICDHFRDRTGKRPSVDTRNPTFRIHVFLTRDQASISLDTSGEALFRRGSRPQAGDAPIKKNLAAGLLALSGWSPGIPLLDPFCGAGTILVEAAEQSLDRAPGLDRSFAFERLRHWPVARHWPDLQEAARSRQLAPGPLPIWGSDLKGSALQHTLENLEAGGLQACVSLKQVNFLESSPPEPSGLLVSNLPYGVRMEVPGENDGAFYAQLGDVLKRRYAGWTACLLSADPELARSIRLKIDRRTPLYNGALECRLYRLSIVAGGNRKAPV